MPFAAPLDIMNRVCQACGVTQIAVIGEDTLNYLEISFAYDKLRRAELKRSVWKFAIRNAVLRPIGAGFMLLAPVLYASTTTYGVGAIVVDSAGLIWQSRTQDNLANQPGLPAVGGGASPWEIFSGPLAVQPFDTTGGTSYFAGELVYETPGDGTFLVYVSLQSGNSQDPRAPSLWISTTQYIRDQVVQYYAAWAIGTTYAAGNTVSYSGLVYVSLIAGSVGKEPDISASAWAVVSATLAPAYYGSTTTYSLGQFVTYLGVNYASRVNSNTGNTPSSSPTQWAAQAAGTFYASLVDFNLNNSPGSAAALWSSLTTYSTGQQVGGSDGMIYTSVGSGNLNHNPVSDGGVHWTNTGVLNPWTTTNPFGSANQAWLQLNSSLTDLQIIYPIGSGPASQSATKNVFRMPAGYLRRAPQDPKAGAMSFLGGPSGIGYDDWLLQGDYLVSASAFPIVLRFVADITDVAAMDDMFCEGLAARIGFEVVERLMQATAKRAALAAAYLKVMGEARLVNGIETGPVEPPEDDYLTVRR